MTVVVDASTVVPLFVSERFSPEATALRAAEASWIAPDLIFAETANVLWKKWRRGEITARHGDATLKLLVEALDEIVPSGIVVARAAEMARGLAHPVYDCLYLACAEAVDAPLVTADRAFVEAVQGSLWQGRATLLGGETDR